MEDFAKIFADLGCARAYNLGGGASSVMVFMGDKQNSPSGGGRGLGHMLIIKEISDYRQER